MPCKLYYSATESTGHWKCALEAGVRNTLLTYWSIDKKPKLLEERKNERPDVGFMIDSGAHTIQKGLQQMSEAQLDAYVARYADWLDKNRTLIECAVEMDIDNIVGVDKVHKWQEKYFIPLEASGVPIIFVWHQERGAQTIMEMARKHAYIGVNAMALDFLPQLFAAARSYLTKVHGFAITREEQMSKFPFYTVDSTTWKAGEMWGDFYYWDGMHMTLFKDKNRRRVYKVQIEATGVNWAKIEADDNYEITKHNAIQFRRMEDDLNRRTATWNYWTSKLPHPNELEKWTDETVKETLTKWKLSPETYDSMDDGYIDLLQASQLQWGLFEDFRKAYKDGDQTWYSHIMRELKPDGTPFTMPLPEDDAGLDTWRVRLNGKVLESKIVQAKKRTPADYIATKLVKRREEVEEVEEVEEQEPILDFYEETDDGGLTG